MTSFRRPRTAVAAASVIATCLAVAAGAVASITADSHYGRHGTVYLGSGKVVAMAPQKGGRTIAVGSIGTRMLVARFSSSGRLQARLNGGTGVGNAVAVQPNGEIVVAGTIAPSPHTSRAGDMVVERFQMNGAPDRGFGRGGVAHLSAAVAYGVALGPNGEIVAAGEVPGTDGAPRVAIAALRANGAPDGSFGKGGVALIDLGQFSQANAVAVQSDGKVVFAGARGIQDISAPVGRVTTRGRLDPSFGQGGLYTYLHPKGGGASTFDAVAIGSGGRILAAGSDFETAGQHALVVRLTPRGQPDGQFGRGGVFTTPSAQFSNAGTLAGPRALSVTPGGEILVAGNSLSGALSYGTIWALTARGALDSRQGRGGVLLTRADGILGAEFNGLALDGSGEVVAGGDAIGLSQTQALVAGYAMRGIR